MYRPNLHAVSCTGTSSLALRTQIRQFLFGQKPLSEADGSTDTGTAENDLLVPPPPPLDNGRHIHVHNHYNTIKLRRSSGSGGVRTVDGIQPLSKRQIAALAPPPPPGKKTPPRLVPAGPTTSTDCGKSASAASHGGVPPIQGPLLSAWTPTYPTKVETILDTIPEHQRGALSVRKLIAAFERLASHRVWSLPASYSSGGGDQPSPTFVEWHPLFLKHPMYGQADQFYEASALKECDIVLEIARAIPTFAVPLSLIKEKMAHEGLDTKLVEESFLVNYQDIVSLDYGANNDKKGSNSSGSPLVKLIATTLPGAGVADEKYLATNLNLNALSNTLVRILPTTFIPFNVVNDVLVTQVSSGERHGLSLSSMLPMVSHLVDRVGNLIRLNEDVKHLDAGKGDAFYTADLLAKIAAEAAAGVKSSKARKRSKRSKGNKNMEEDTTSRRKKSSAYKDEMYLDACLARHAPVNTKKVHTAFPRSFASTVIIASTELEANDAAAQLLEEIQMEKELLRPSLADHNELQQRVALGMDCEWVDNGASGVALLQLATRRTVFLFRLRIEKVMTSPRMPTVLLNILQSSEVLKCGVGIFGDVQELKRNGQVDDLRGCVDVAQAMLACGFPSQVRGLEAITQRLCSVSLRKNHDITVSNWESHTLRKAQVNYAANDARASLATFLSIKPLFLDATSIPFNLDAIVDKGHTKEWFNQLRLTNVTYRIKKLLQEKYTPLTENSHASPTSPDEEDEALHAVMASSEQGATHEEVVAALIAANPATVQGRKRLLLQLVERYGMESEPPLNKQWVMHHHEHHAGHHASPPTVPTPLPLVAQTTEEEVMSEQRAETVASPVPPSSTKEQEGQAVECIGAPEHNHIEDRQVHLDNQPYHQHQEEAVAQEHFGTPIGDEQQAFEDPSHHQSSAGTGSQSENGTDQDQQHDGHHQHHYEQQQQQSPPNDSTDFNELLASVQQGGASTEAATAHCPTTTPTTNVVEELKSDTVATNTVIADVMSNGEEQAATVVEDVALVEEQSPGLAKNTVPPEGAQQEEPSPPAPSAPTTMPTTMLPGMPPFALNPDGTVDVNATMATLQSFLQQHQQSPSSVSAMASTEASPAHMPVPPSTTAATTTTPPHDMNGATPPIQQPFTASGSTLPPVMMNTPVTPMMEHQHQQPQFTVPSLGAPSNGAEGSTGKAATQQFSATCPPLIDQQPQQFPGHHAEHAHHPAHPHQPQQQHVSPPTPIVAAAPQHYEEAVTDDVQELLDLEEMFAQEQRKASSAPAPPVSTQHRPSSQKGAAPLGKSKPETPSFPAGLGGTAIEPELSMPPPPAPSPEAIIANSHTHSKKQKKAAAEPSVPLPPPPHVVNATFPPPPPLAPSTVGSDGFPTRSQQQPPQPPSIDATLINPFLQQQPETQQPSPVMPQMNFSLGGFPPQQAAAAPTPHADGIGSSPPVMEQALLDALQSMMNPPAGGGGSDGRAGANKDDLLTAMFGNSSTSASSGGSNIPANSHIMNSLANDLLHAPIKSPLVGAVQPTKLSTTAGATPSPSTPPPPPPPPPSSSATSWQSGHTPVVGDHASMAPANGGVMGSSAAASHSQQPLNTPTSVASPSNPFHNPFVTAGSPGVF